MWEMEVLVSAYIFYGRELVRPRKYDEITRVYPTNFIFKNLCLYKR